MTDDVEVFELHEWGPGRWSWRQHRAGQRHEPFATKENAFEDVVRFLSEHQLEEVDRGQIFLLARPKQA